ncbi:DUF2199 domain-containing protein [Brachybacterium sp. YJGR34]|uniref:DUF2199 domain-containing protein n=1 Tax=Brachybacterium sp. YJGR34 TaxID=2059911 RepID=UPI000E0A8BE0|nr:DUF2199 domain-containing protein [Brachybacterium sp. YJGR34]
MTSHDDHVDRDDHRAHCADCGRPLTAPDGTLLEPWPGVDYPCPDAYLALSGHEREHHARGTEELCMIWVRPLPDFYLRGILRIPVRGEDLGLESALWVQVSEESFLDYTEHYEDPEHSEVYPGQLATQVDGYSRSTSLPVQILTRGMELPLVVPDSTVSHPLVRDVYDGIDRSEAELRLRALLLPASEG